MCGVNCLVERFFLAIFLFASIILASAQAPSAPGKPLPPGPMQAKVKAACTSCHNTSRITEQHLTRKGWSEQLEKMEGLGAVIPDADREAFLNYLTKNFGPQKGGAKNAAKSAVKNPGPAPKYLLSVGIAGVGTGASRACPERSRRVQAERRSAA